MFRGKDSPVPWNPQSVVPCRLPPRLLPLPSAWQPLSPAVRTSWGRKKWIDAAANAIEVPLKIGCCVLLLNFFLLPDPAWTCQMLFCPLKLCHLGVSGFGARSSAQPLSPTSKIQRSLCAAARSRSTFLAFWQGRLNPKISQLALSKNEGETSTDTETDHKLLLFSSIFMEKICGLRDSPLVPGDEMWEKITVWRGGNPLTRSMVDFPVIKALNTSVVGIQGGKKIEKLTFGRDSYCERIHGLSSRQSLLQYSSTIVDPSGWWILSWEYPSNYDGNFTAYSSTIINQVLVLLTHDWNK